MSDYMPVADVANAERFEAMGVAADAENAANTREDFAGWLRRFFDLDDVRANDVVLSVNEALANAAEFAYLLFDRPGTVDVQAAHVAEDARLVVTIADRGIWRTPEQNRSTRIRGRGIPLMRALSDYATIETSPGGTRVVLEWHGVHRI